jgi:hypothetical protein
MRRQNQKGGLFGSLSNWWSGSSSSVVDGTENILGSSASAISSGLSSATNSVQGMMSSDVDVSGSNSSSAVDSGSTVDSSSNSGSTVDSSSNSGSAVDSSSELNNSAGGKRRHRMKGGKGDLGLTYYATQVQGSNVAEPTYMINGNNMNGGSRRRKGRKTRKMRKSRKSRHHRRR